VKRFLVQAGMFPEAAKAGAAVDGFRQRIMNLQACIKYEQDDIPGKEGARVWIVTASQTHLCCLMRCRHSEVLCNEQERRKSGFGALACQRLQGFSPTACFLESWIQPK
jgi:hypothetical protein